MAFQTGTASSFSDLQSQVETFLTSNGYTLTSGIITKAGTQIHVAFTNDANNFMLEMGKDSSAGSLLHTHPTRISSVVQLVGMGVKFNESATGIIDMVFPINYDFQVWANPENEFRCTIEYNNGYIQNVGFGEIVKSVDMDGGIYIDATGCLNYTGGNIGSELISSYTPFQCVTSTNSRAGSNPTPFGYGRVGLTSYTASTQVWAEFMGFDWYISTDINGTNETGNKYNRSTDPFFAPLRATQHNYKEMEGSLQAHNGNAALVPIRLYGQNPNDNYAPIGSIRNIRHLNIKHLNIGQVLDDGTDKWKVYPSYFKDASTLNGAATHSGQMGFAVRYDGL